MAPPAPPCPGAVLLEWPFGILPADHRVYCVWRVLEEPGLRGVFVTSSERLLERGGRYFSGHAALRRYSSLAEALQQFSLDSPEALSARASGTLIPAADPWAVWLLH